MIRAARLEDVGEIARIHVETWRSAYAGIMPAEYLVGLSVEARQSQWTRTLRHNARDLIVAEDGPALAGFGNSSLFRDGETGVGGEVFAVYVLPEFQGRGHGRDLMDAIESDFRRRAVTHSTLRVLEGNRPARRFYEGLGYRDTGAAMIEVFGGASLNVLRYRKDF